MLSRLSNLQAIQKRLRTGHTYLASGEEHENEDLFEITNVHSDNCKNQSEKKLTEQDKE